LNQGYPEHEAGCDVWSLRSLIDILEREVVGLLYNNGEFVKPRYRESIFS
jgi:hypothetical protein